MSIKVMSYVWDGFPGSGSELLVMLAMADWCNDAGGSLYPSMRMVAEKIRVSEKQARRIVQSLEQDGYLAVVGNAHGGAPGTTKQFRVNVEKLKSLAVAREQTPPASVTPPMDVTRPMEGRGTAPTGVPDGSHPGVQTPPTHGSQTTIEPSVNRQEEKSAYALAIPDALLHDFQQVRKAKRAGPLTQTAIAGIEREAAKAGISVEQAVTACCEYGWQGFRADWYADRNTGRPRAVAAAEPEWRSEQRRRTQQAAPGVAARKPADQFFLDVKATDVTPHRLG